MLWSTSASPVLNKNFPIEIEISLPPMNLSKIEQMSIWEIMKIFEENPNSVKKLYHPKISFAR